MAVMYTQVHISLRDSGMNRRSRAAADAGLAG